MQKIPFSMALIALTSKISRRAIAKHAKSKLKHIVMLVLLFAFATSFALPANAMGVILALSGGGTRGLAHIGVIEVLEENNIPVLGIVGTSMGSLIGALKASGYDAHEMRDIIKNLDLPSLLSENTGPMFVSLGNDDRARKSTVSALTYKKDGNHHGPTGILKGDKLYQYFARLMRHVSVTDFYQLPIPYAAVAADITTGEKVVLREGNLASAMRASMSIPALFEPWEIDGHLLVDGGIVSNLPVYTAQEIFPDMPIVAVDVSSGLSSERSMNSYLDVIDQALVILMRRTTDEESQAADILVTPDVAKFDSLDTREAEAIIEAGRVAALSKIGEIRTLSAKSPALFSYSISQNKSNIVGEVHITGVPPKMADALENRYLDWKGKAVDTEELDADVKRLQSSQGISMADYTLGRTDSGDVLVRVDVKQEPELTLGLSGYTTNLHGNRWLYLKGTARKLLSEYDSLSGVASIGEQWGLDLMYQTAPATMNAWQFNLNAQNWEMDTTAGHREWDRYSFGVSRVYQAGDVNLGFGLAYEFVNENDGPHADDYDNYVGPTFFASYDTLDIPGDPTTGYAWNINAWWPNLEQILYRFTYFKPLDVGENWRTYFRFGYVEGDQGSQGHATYLGAAEELYTAAAKPIEAERMGWVNLAFRRVLDRSAIGVVAAEFFGSYGYAMDRHYGKIAAPWEVGVALTFPNNIVDIKLAAMYGSEEFKIGFFIGVPFWNHYPLP